MGTIITPLPAMAGKSTLADKSEIVGINGYPLVTLQVETAGTVSAGQIKVKACPSNAAYVGQTIATLNFPLEGGTAGFIAVASPAALTNAYAEITTALVGGTISAARLVLSTY